MNLKKNLNTTIRRIIKEEYGDAVDKEIEDRLSKDREDNMGKTDPSKEYVRPSKKVMSNVCRREGICNEQGPITFGQLERLINTAQNKKLGINIGEGVYKSMLRLLPWFIPQIAIGAFVGSSMRAINKIIKPALETTKGYKSWWGKTILTIMNYAEGDLPTGDPLSKIFFVSDGLLELMNDKHKLKFARYVSEVATLKPDNEVVPPHFVENLLRDWINQKFLLDPPLQKKNINEGYKETLLTLGLLLGANMAVSQTKADELISNPTEETIQNIDSIVKDNKTFTKYVDNVRKFGTLKKPKVEFIDDWIRYKGMDFKFKPPVLNRGQLLVGVRFPIK